MPTPRPNDESQDEWMDRCMSSDEAQADFPDQDQRAAFCASEWEDAVSKSEDDNSIPIGEIDKAHPGNLSETLLAEMNDPEVRAQKQNVEALLSRIAEDAEKIVNEFQERGLDGPDTPLLNSLVDETVEKASHAGMWMQGLVEEMDQPNSEIIESIASEAGVTTEAVRRWLRGDTNCPSAGNLVVAAEELKVSNAEMRRRFEADGCDYSDTDLSKAEDDTEDVKKEYDSNLLKADDEKQIVYGVVLEPNKPDAHGDVISREEVEQAAHRFLREKVRASRDPREINRDHAADMEAEIVETWTLKQAREIGGVELNAGTWVAGVHVPDSDQWSRVKKGHWNGFSIEGRGKRITAP